jgi:hypothetical protein
MTTTRDFDAEYLAACTADRTPGASLADRAAAQRQMSRIVTAADRAGSDLYARMLDIDEQARLALYPA